VVGRGGAPVVPRATTRERPDSPPWPAVLDLTMLVLARLIDLYSLVVLVAVILSWIPMDRRHPLVTITKALTDPVLVPIRNVVPPIAGLDLSPMVLLIALQIVKDLLL
jgi:YggT family protein